MLRIKDLKTLRKLKHNNKENETALVEENHNLYKWNGDSWDIIGHTGVDTSLYQINQAIYTSLPAMIEEDIQKGRETIRKFCEAQDGAIYFVLMNRENYDFTMFHAGFGGQEPKIEDAVIDLLQSRGELKDIDLTEEGKVSPQGVECWVTKDKTSKVYYLFNYQEGVIECQ
jgi:hypothetical protein